MRARRARSRNASVCPQECSSDRTARSRPSIFVYISAAVPFVPWALHWAIHDPNAFDTIWFMLTKNTKNGAALNVGSVIERPYLNLHGRLRKETSLCIGIRPVR